MKNNKKILSILAGLALSGTMVVGSIGLTACNNGDNNAKVDLGNKVAISTALGTSYSSTGGKVYYVSADVIGNTEAGKEGDITQPFDFFTLLTSDKLQPGDTVYMLPGVYNSTSTLTIPATVKGAYNKYIRILNAGLCKDESKYTGADTKVTLSFYGQEFDSTSRGVQLYGSYTYWYGIDVAGAGDNGFYIGGSYNTVEYGEFYDNRDSGLQLGRQESSHNSMTQWPSFNLIKNCTSHNNYDNETFGENADGFAAKLTLGYGNVFDGCIAYRNSDDGWDLYAKVDSGNIGAVIIYNCVAFENGILEYDRDTCNSLYPTFALANANNEFKDETADKYFTRDGDGNGFKLGGSVMEGDVVMYNCLSFNNRMHGVTDNSNPGYLKVEGVTSYDNSAHVSGASGDIVYVNLEKGENNSHNNIDVARQTYSYNTVKGVLSVNSGISTTVGSDAYRGTVFNSLLSAGAKTNVINGGMEADTNSSAVDDYTSQIDALAPNDVFVQLPIEYTPAGAEAASYKYNINGSNDSGEVKFAQVAGVQVRDQSQLNADRVHHAYRNEADNSINMHDILAMKDTFVPSSYIDKLGEDEIFGATLNKTEWKDYTHFVNEDLFKNVENEDLATALKVKETLTINTQGDAVYQDFEVPVVMQNASISWATSDEEHLKIGTEVESSVSGSQYITLIVYRDAHEDKQVTITATISVGSATQTKEFELTIKQGDPSVGAIRVITPDGRIITDGSEIVDQYDLYAEPEISVLNGLYPDAEKPLAEDLYNLESTYMYASSKNAASIEIKGFTPSVAGVYTITHKVSLKEDPSKFGTMSYTVFVASPAADVDFDEKGSTVNVNRYGFIISGGLSSATGKIYAVTSATALELTPETIKTQAGLQVIDFRNDTLTEQFTNPNNAAYHIYYALGNVNGEVTSQIYTAEVIIKDISNTTDFMTVAGGGKLANETASTTIYRLTTDLDFKDVKYASKGSGTFSGVLNGQGKKVSNITVSGAKNTGVFGNLVGGTLMNIKFDNLSITSTSERAGLFSESKGGYIYNVAITNYSFTSSSQRNGGLIGYVIGENSERIASTPLEISQVSIINNLEAEDNDHVFTASSRIGGLIGYVQYYRNTITIDNCQVITNMDAGSEVAGLVASWEDQKQDQLLITNCYYKGTIKVGSSARGAGMLGYHKGGLGKLRITGCISLLTLYQNDGLLEASIKNGSPIIGNYSGTADVLVSRCIGSMQEHNSDYDSTSYQHRTLRLPVIYGDNPDSGLLNLDFTKWSYVYDETSKANGDGTYQYLAEPYVLLNYIEG